MGRRRPSQRAAQVQAAPVACARHASQSSRTSCHSTVLCNARAGWACAVGSLDARLHVVRTGLSSAVLGLLGKLRCYDTGQAAAQQQARAACTARHAPLCTTTPPSPERTLPASGGTRAAAQGCAGSPRVWHTPPQRSAPALHLPGRRWQCCHRTAAWRRGAAGPLASPACCRCRRCCRQHWPK